MGQPTNWTTEAAQRSPWPTPGTLRQLIVELSSAPGVGTSRTFTLRLNGIDTALTVTLSDTDLTARVIGVDVAVATGDLVALQATLSGVPASTSVRWSLEFEGTLARMSGYTGPIGSAAGGGGDRFTGVFSLPSSIATTAANARNLVAVAGTVTGMVASVSTSLGAINGFTFYLTKNGVRQDGSGGTVNTTCALTSGLAASTTFSLSVVPGDLVSTEAVVVGTFTTRNWGLGVSFVADTDGESHLCGVSNTTLSTAATNFGLVQAGSATLTSTETTFASRATGSVTPMTLGGLQVLLNPAPGGAASRTIDLRINEASPGPTLTLTGAVATGSDTVRTAVVADGDLWSLRWVPAATPLAAFAHWGLIQQTPTTAPAIVLTGELDRRTLTTATGALNATWTGTTSGNWTAGLVALKKT